MFTLHNGDCLTVLPSIPSGSIDAIITDLPYGTTACKWDTVIEFAPMWKEVKRVLKPNGAFITTASQPFTSALIMSNPSMFKCEWIWDKGVGNNFATVKYQPFKEHENIIVFGKGTITYNPQKIKRSDYSLKCHPVGSKHLVPSTGKAMAVNGLVGKPHYMSADGMRNPRSIIVFKPLKGRGKRSPHPTRKPVALYEYLIKTYTNEGETVLDIAMGSGTTGVAAIQTGREFIGIEKEQKYFEIAEKRITQAHPPLFTETAMLVQNEAHQSEMHLPHP